VRLYHIIAILLAVWPVSAHADDFTIHLTPGWDREITAMTDYVVRGLSQTKGRPSIGGTVIYTLANGVYAGITAEHSQIAEQSVELDVVGGWKTALTADLSYQAGFVYQTYPASRFHSQNNVELQQIINVNLTPWATGIAAIAIQPQAAQHAGFQSYVSAGMDFTLPGDVTVGGRLGYLTAQNHAIQVNYVDWTVTVARDMGHGITLALQYTGLTARCSVCGNRMVASINFAF
jgi:uncharacterized protein (TIGR02001 family)